MIIGCGDVYDNQDESKPVVCGDGFVGVGDGVNCVDIDSCELNPCFPDVECTDVPAPDTGFICGDCPPGLTGDGINCEDINGCAHNPCFSGVECTDVPAPGIGFVCGDCPAHYTGDGEICEPVNHCEEHTHTCDPQAECVYTGPGTYDC